MVKINDGQNTAAQTIRPDLKATRGERGPQRHDANYRMGNTCAGNTFTSIAFVLPLGAQTQFRGDSP